MDIFNLMDELKDIINKDETNYPRIYIQVEGCEALLRGIKYFPEGPENYECVVLSDEENVKMCL